MTTSIVALIAVDLDKTRHLRFNLKALRLAEQELGKREGKKVSLARLFQTGEVSFGDIGVLLWAGLLHEEPGLTLDAVEEMVDMHQITAITEKILAAWNVATSSETPSGQAAGGNGSDPLPPSTGASSGVSDVLTSASANPSSGA